MSQTDSDAGLLRERFFHKSFASLFLAIVYFSRKTHENIAPDFLYDFVAGAVAIVNDYYFKLFKFEILKKSEEIFIASSSIIKFF